ncbi:MAG: hypothetical protein HQ536_04395 [Parcubacteria group bacterium]|nr:hypothetical protein [Parcubacteria group bacterium]
MLKYIAGTLGMVVGFLMVWKATWLLINFGRVDFAEKYLGTMGGSRLFYKLIGIAILLICFIWVSGTLDDILLAVLGPMFSGMAK